MTLAKQIARELMGNYVIEGNRAETIDMLTELVDETRGVLNGARIARGQIASAVEDGFENPAILQALLKPYVPDIVEEIARLLRPYEAAVKKEWTRRDAAIRRGETW